MKYLFNCTHQSKTPTAIPYLTYNKTNGDAHYSKKKNLNNQPLTFILRESGSFKFTNPIYYSTNLGKSWILLNANTDSPTLEKYESIMWKAELTPNSSSGIGTFSSTCNFDVEGNPMSLLYGDNFIKKIDLTGKNYTFFQLFYNCSKLINAKNLSLPATILANYCYASMFNGCIALTVAPELPATILAVSCYNGMFYGCTSLTTAPKLPAITLATYCYNSMFNGCTSLTTAPELQATTLADYCYNYMFKGCTSLTTAPELPATRLVSNCYRKMFYGCSNLNYIKAMFTTTPTTTYTENWVNGVASNGIFIKNNEATWNVTGVDGVPQTWTKHNISDINITENVQISTSNYIHILSSNTNSYIKLSDLCSAHELYISKTRNYWETMTTSKVYPIDSGVYICGTLQDAQSDRDYTSFKFYNGQITISGNCLSLWNYTNLNTLNAYCGYNLFANCTNLVNAKNLLLPATTLADWCYEAMFQGCSSLTTAPELPATILATGCYASMFYNCTALTAAPELSATTLATGCYMEMFKGCSSLTTAPELPVTTLATYCYASMFDGCTSLTSAPELPATTLENSCYENMFCNCISLAYAPELPATTLVDHCYTDMFAGCSSLLVVPDLPATTLATYCYAYMFKDCINLTTTTPLYATTLAQSCYANMFEGCINLFDTSISILPATTLATNCYTCMFQGCTALTIAPELHATILANACYSHMFEGCTNLIATPELPATTLASNCYASMFNGCTSLTTASELPATTLIEHCYASMFFGCTSLTTAPELPATTLKTYCYQQMFYGCTSLTTAPELPATTLTDHCYSGMFHSCTSLTTAPELPATTLQNYCYAGMFYGCTSLTSTPTLSATTLKIYCYQYMFSDCTALTTAPELPATTLTDYCYQNMFRNCTALTTAPELPATTLANYCYAGMYYGCINLVNIPHILPAKTLKNYCYYQMFRDCWKITKSPVLPATTLASKCYEYMFYGCSQLSEVTALFTTTPGTSYTSNWLYGVKSSGIFYRNQNATWTTTSVHGKPSTWTFNYFYNMNNLISAIDAEWSTDYNKQNLRDIITGSIIGSNLTDYSTYIHNNYIQFNNSFYLTYNLQSVFDAIENKAFSMEVVFNWQSKAGSSGSTIYALGQNNTGGNYRIIWTWGTTNVTGVAFYQTGTSTTSVSALSANILYKIIITVNEEGVGTYYLYNLQTNTLVQTVTLSKGAATLNPENNNIIQINSLPGYTKYRSNMKVCSVRFYNKTLLTTDPEITNGNVLDAQRFTTLS